MRGEGHRRHRGDDRPLAAVLARNASAFLVGAQAFRARFPHLNRYNLAVAIELSLKAYLLHRGISDDWNRIHIRHDLVKALRCARRAGFRTEPPGLGSIAAALNPYYQTHSIVQMPAEVITPVNWERGHETTWALLLAVEAAINPCAQSEDRRRIRTPAPWPGLDVTREQGMGVLKIHTFDHVGRQFEIRAETYSDPAYVEAAVFEDDKPARVTLPGGLPASLVFGASFHRSIHSEDAEAIEALIACTKRALCMLLPVSPEVELPGCLRP